MECIGSTCCKYCSVHIDLSIDQSHSIKLHFVRESVFYFFNVVEYQVIVYDLLNSWGHEGYEMHCEKYVIACHLKCFFVRYLTKFSVSVCPKIQFFCVV